MIKWPKIWKLERRSGELDALRQQIDDLQARERETAERLSTVFEYSNDAILLIDPLQDKIIDANPKSCRMLEYSRQELLSIGISDIHPHEIPEMMAFAQSVLEQGHGWTDALTCATKTGQLVPAEMSAAVANIGDRRCIVSAVRDVTGRKWAEQALRAIVEGTASTTGEDFFRSLVRQLASALQVRQALVAELVDSDTGLARILASWMGDGLRPELRPRGFGDNVVYSLDGTPGAKIIQGAICYYPQDVQSLFPGQEGIEGYLAVPLYGSTGEVLGHLAVKHDRALPQQSHALSVLKVFAARAGAELERQRMDEALARRAQEMDDLYDVSLEINALPELPALLPAVARQAAELLGARRGSVFLLRPDDQALELAAVHNQPDDRLGAALRLGQGLAGRVAVSGEPLMVGDYERWAGRTASLYGGLIGRILGVPLKCGEQVIGVLNIFDDEAGQFNEGEVQLLCLFANQAAVAIENAQLRRRAEQAAVLAERGRLSRELHDSVTQSLYSLTLLAEGWRRLAAAGKLPSVDEPLTELGEIAQQALKEMRLLVYELRPPELEKDGLLGALRQRLGAVEKRAGVEARLVAQDLVDLPGPVEQALYRVAQEALNNALKHAAATLVTVNLRVDGERVELEISDDGIGFASGQGDLDAGRAPGGLGLSGMRERMQKLGGALTVRSRPGEGTSVIANVKR